MSHSMTSSILLYSREGHVIHSSTTSKIAVNPNSADPFGPASVGPRRETPLEMPYALGSIPNFRQIVARLAAKRLALSSPENNSSLYFRYVYASHIHLTQPLAVGS